MNLRHVKQQIRIYVTCSNCAERDLSMHSTSKNIDTSINLNRPSTTMTVSCTTSILATDCVCDVCVCVCVRVVCVRV